jgi:RNA polymerase sigma factor (sigma-70 family)
VESDAHIVEAARDGDRSAFARLYERYAPMVHGLLLARVSPDDAEDLVQDVFVRALRKLPRLREPEAFGGWLAAIARRRAADHHRRAPRTNALPADVAGRPRPVAEALAALGAPRIDAEPIDDDGRLGVGQWLETDSESRAEIRVGEIGQVVVEPDTRLGLAAALPNDHRLDLERGTIHALILAPPGQFFVQTPSALAVDLGCAYTLHVDESGAGEIEVTMGWVAFERDGRESFVPAEARCATRPEVGPGTPFFDDASPALRDGLERIDFGPSDSSGRAAALETVLEEARPRDGLTLWHLLSRVTVRERAAVYERFAELVPPPEGVSRAGVLGADQAILDLWWDTLGLGDTSWWRRWKGPVPGEG